MNTPRFDPQRLIDLFERSTIATMEDMKNAPEFRPGVADSSNTARIRQIDVRY
jgi:hypothetical protein